MQSETVANFPELLTKEQVAERLQVDVRTVENLMKDGTLPYFKLGKRNAKAKRDKRSVRFDPTSVRAHLEQKCKSQ